MADALIYDHVRTPRGRGRPDGSLREITAVELAATPLRALADRNGLDTALIDDVVYGCAQPVGEQGGNIGRAAVLTADWAESVAGQQVHRFCASALEAVNNAAAQVMTGAANAAVGGGVESMSRAPFVMPKATSAFSRANEVHDTTIGWRFVNKLMKEHYGVDSMPETAENVAEDFGISRPDQDAFALRSQQKAAKAQVNGRLAQEIVPVTIPQRKGDPLVIDIDEHPRSTTTYEGLKKLRPFVKADGTVTAGNASGVNDGSAALVLSTKEAAEKHGLKPIARVLGGATAGVAPRIMGFGPAPASRKLLARLGLRQEEFAVIEVNEAFASQGLATLRNLGIADDDVRVNPNGGAIALGHPLGMSGARITGTAMLDLKPGEKSLSTMCIGVGQGIAIALEAV